MINQLPIATTTKEDVLELEDQVKMFHEPGQIHDVSVPERGEYSEAMGIVLEQFVG